jgi:hypothetical protein
MYKEAAVAYLKTFSQIFMWELKRKPFLIA